MYLKSIFQNPGEQGCCPMCKRPYPPPRKIFRGPVRQAIYDYVAKHPHGVTRDQIFNAVYGDDPNGGPIDMQVIAVTVHHINKALAGTGTYIRNTGGRWGVYKLYGAENEGRTASGVGAASHP